MIEIIKKKKPASMVENMLVMMINMVVMCAFLVIIFGAFSGISDKWGMRQTAREYMLIMETEGYLPAPDQSALIAELGMRFLIRLVLVNINVGFCLRLETRELESPQRK